MGRLSSVTRGRSQPDTPYGIDSDNIVTKIEPEIPLALSLVWTMAGQRPARENRSDLSIEARSLLSLARRSRGRPPNQGHCQYHRGPATTNRPPIIALLYTHQRHRSLQPRSAKGNRGRADLGAIGQDPESPAGPYPLHVPDDCSMMTQSAPTSQGAFQLVQSWKQPLLESLINQSSPSAGSASSSGNPFQSGGSTSSRCRTKKSRRRRSP